jgi:hypothetical protein
MASKRAIRRRSCERKRRYPTEAEARRGAAALNRRQPDKVHAYRCAFCGLTPHWHVGHPPLRVARAIADRRGGRP